MDQKLTTTDNITQFLISIGYIAIPIRQNIAGQLLINAKINYVEGVYILDTGAGTTVVDAKQADTLKLRLSIEESELTGGGVGGHGMENIPSYNNVVEINNIKIDNIAIAVMSLESAWQSLASVGAHDELFGMMGVDILKSGNAIMEFSTMTLYLKQPKLS
jgi:predicted aspartyl protease